ncbi:uncharacterized protein B0I36DRAFT_132554 [Microdochium trichocladiopsis]|uniref:Uncharacterized protein n=1 Tax=Microdochium trichocladiopsis TaxID=1682393 RepID=A0A9P8Y5J5_9PEZI|nr:uncharacterized protein B0I36DRAFT_132554 [Microdochium trichocladiopsis]KAH7029430.1 hypothetical protein B0I36DRAFT_132554 [Microdochium trichocladiopsis]
MGVAGLVIFIIALGGISCTGKARWFRLSPYNASPVSGSSLISIIQSGHRGSDFDSMSVSRGSRPTASVSLRFIETRGIYICVCVCS